MLIFKQAIIILAFLSIFSNCQEADKVFKQWKADRYNYMKNEPLPYIYGWETLMVESIVQFINPFETQQYYVIPSNNNENTKLVFAEEDGSIKDVQGIGAIEKQAQFINFNSKSNTGQWQLGIADRNTFSAFDCFKLSCTVNLQIKSNFGQVTSLQYSQSQNLVYVGTLSQGLFRVDLVQNQYQLVKDIQNISSLALNQSMNILAIGSEKKQLFWSIDLDEWRFEYTKSFSAQILCQTWRESDRTLWVGGDESSITVFQFEEQDDNEFPFYLMHRAGLIQGLPVGGHLFAYTDAENDRVYLGGQKGIVSFDKSIENIFAFKNFSDYHDYQGVGQIGSPQSPWRFFYGERFLAQGDLIIFSVNFGKIYTSTTYGTSVIIEYDETLSAKAAVFEENVLKRMDRLGYVQDNTLLKPGDPDSYTNRLSDNEGMWNNMYLTAESYRYKATKDPKAKEQAWNTFKAQQRLYNVIPPQFYGLMAKACAYITDPLPDDLWHQSTQPGYEMFMFKENASSDDITSYFYAFPPFIEYVCETQEEKDLATSYILRTMDYIIEGNYTMTNLNGEKTHWGFWDPQRLNNDPEFYSERYLNSLEIISYLAVAYKYSGNDQKYLDQIRILGEEYGYYQNLINWRFQDTNDVNFSDDELGFLAYGAFFFVQDVMPQDVVDILKTSLKKAWSMVQDYQSSWYTYQTAINLIDDPDFENIVSSQKLQQARQELTDWSMDWIMWNVDNSERLDIVPLRRTLKKYNANDDDEFVLKNPQMSSTLRRIERVCTYKWNGSPYQISQVNNGNQEIAPTPWLLPYSLDLYYEQLLEKKQLESFQKKNSQKFLRK